MIVSVLFLHVLSIVIGNKLTLTLFFSVFLRPIDGRWLIFMSFYLENGLPYIGAKTGI
jgi:hypothetical protein